MANVRRYGPSCSFCLNARNPMANTHYLRDEKGQNSCPFLAVNICDLCASPGHTAGHCNYLEQIMDEVMVAQCNIDDDIEQMPDNPDPEFERQYLKKKAKRCDKETKVLIARDFLYYDRIRIENTLEKFAMLRRMVAENNGKIEQEWMDEKYKKDFNWCKFCYLKDPYNIICATHTTHCVHTGRTLCPNLLCTRCPRCRQLGHTGKFCGVEQRKPQPYKPRPVVLSQDLQEEVMRGMGDLDQFELDFETETTGATHKLPFQFTGSATYQVENRKRMHATRSLRFTGSVQFQELEKIRQRRHLRALRNGKDSESDSESEEEISDSAIDNDVQALMNEIKI